MAGIKRRHKIKRGWGLAKYFPAPKKYLARPKGSLVYQAGTGFFPRRYGRRRKR